MRWHNVLVCVSFVVFLKNWSDSFTIWTCSFLVESFTAPHWHWKLKQCVTYRKLCCLDKNLASFPSVPMITMVCSHPCKTLWIIVFSPLPKAKAKWIPSDLKFTCARVHCICLLSIVTQITWRGLGVGKLVLRSTSRDFHLIQKVAIKPG